MIQKRNEKGQVAARDWSVYIGQKFGRYTIASLAGRAGAHQRVVVICECGTKREVFISGLLCGRIKSCGCWRASRMTQANVKHGDAERGHRTLTYGTWMAMRRRCFDRKHKDYARWGGKGITACERWNDYALFLADMGERPSRRHSLDRYPDRNGNYEPSNCRWATDAEQNRNRTMPKHYGVRPNREPMLVGADRTGEKET